MIIKQHLTCVARLRFSMAVSQRATPADSVAVAGHPQQHLQKVMQGLNCMPNNATHAAADKHKRISYCESTCMGSRG
jgi:hypothetical protein